jgi:hypothetical protein
VTCPHASIGHARCQHLNYDMTCADFAALVDRACARCEMCLATAADTKQGKLHIDHDHRRGPWAVRGILCSYCNINGSVDAWAPRRSDAAKTYLSRSWVDEAHGSRVEIGDEPHLGVTVAAGTTRRIWTRADVGWWPAPGHGGMVVSWRRLNHLYAPHRFVTLGANAAPLMHWLIAAEVAQLRSSRDASREHDVTSHVVTAVSEGAP